MTAVAQPTVSMQGVASPDVTVDPGAFFQATRKLTYPMRAITPIAGLGSTDSTQLRQTGIVAGLWLRVTGTITFTGTVTTTVMSWRWPYDLVKALRVSANGQSNLINCKGSWLKYFEMAADHDLSDRGVTRNFGAASSGQGSLSMASEDWGTSGANTLGPGVAVPAAGTYTVNLSYFVPIAADQIHLIGAIFAQTAATNLTCDIDWETQNNLLTAGTATFSQNLQYQIQGVVYSIPTVGGKAVVPDLSQFHQIAQTQDVNVGQGDNEKLLPGTGVGRKLLRVAWQVWQGSSFPLGQPLAVNETNFGPLGWRYGGNDNPELYANGRQMRFAAEYLYSSDIGAQFGIAAFDFANQFALRDVVDEGATSDLRILYNLIAAPTTPRLELVQETLFSPMVGA